MMRRSQIKQAIGQNSVLVQPKMEQVLVYDDEDIAEVAVVSYEASQFQYGLFHMKSSYIKPQSCPNDNDKHLRTSKNLNNDLLGAYNGDISVASMEDSAETNAMHEDSLLKNLTRQNRAQTERKI